MECVKKCKLHSDTADDLYFKDIESDFDICDSDDISDSSDSEQGDLQIQFSSNIEDTV